MTLQRTILLASSDPKNRTALVRGLAATGARVVDVGTASEAESALSTTVADLVVLDAPVGARDTLPLLQALKERAPELPVIVVTDPRSHAQAADAIRHGATSAIDRDADPALLLAVAAAGFELRGQRREVARLRRESSAGRNRVALLGRSEAMREMSHQVDQLAVKGVSVVISGATGTGKSLVAREVHARSPRAGAPFVGVSCMGVSEVLLRSQLFGHRRGAFPGAAHDHEGAVHLATGGTLFLDRVEMLSQPSQAALVAALSAGSVAPLGAAEARPFDVRLVSTSNRDVEAMVREGVVREDLYRKVGQAHLRLPALRDRREDILFLAEAFVAEEGERFGVTPRRLDAGAQEVLLTHPWPGNVRELRAAIQHAFALASGDTITSAHLPVSVRAGARAGLKRDPDRLPTLAEAEAELVAQVLEDSAGNKTRAARRLGIDRKRLYRKIRRYRLLGPGESDVDDAADEGDDED